MGRDSKHRSLTQFSWQTIFRFRTFLFDSEGQRWEAGLLAQDDYQHHQHQHRHSVDSHSSDDDAVYPGGASSTRQTANGGTLTGSTAGSGVNVFDYIDVQAAKSPVFYNFSYSRDLSPVAAAAAANEVLRPSFHVFDLEIWEYFLREELRHGPSYDPELLDLDLAAEDELNSSTDTVSLSPSDAQKTTLTSGYDCLPRASVDCCSALLEEIAALEAELGALPPTRWKTTWENLDVPPVLPPRAQVQGAHPVALTTPSLTARNHARQMHKHSTMELIIRGKMGGGSGAVAAGAPAQAEPGGAYGSHPHAAHRLEKHNYPTPTTCEVCSGLLWGPVMPGLRCADCGYNCHEKCVDTITRGCPARYKAAGAGPGSTTVSASGLPRDGTADNLQQLERDLAQPLSRLAPQEADLYSQFSPSTADESSQILRQGYLHKQANFKIKGWKQRWFQLDATKHQLKYYDTREDFHCKGHIDLSEVSEVTLGSSQPGAPKRDDAGCFFDLHTVKRTYCFAAESAEATKDWMTKIQSCLTS